MVKQTERPPHRAARSRRALGHPTRRRIAGMLVAMALDVVVVGHRDGAAHPLLFIKRVPPTVIIVMDTSMRMLEDGSGTFYDPGFYNVSDDLTVMGAFPNIDVTTTKTYRRIYQESSVRRVAGKYTADSIAATAAAWDPASPLTSDERRRRRLSGPDPLLDREPRRCRRRVGEQRHHLPMGI